LQFDQAKKVSAMPLRCTPQQMTITTPEAALDRSIASYHIHKNKSGISSQT